MRKHELGGELSASPNRSASLHQSHSLSPSPPDITFSIIVGLAHSYHLINTYHSFCFQFPNRLLILTMPTSNEEPYPIENYSKSCSAKFNTFQENLFYGLQALYLIPTLALLIWILVTLRVRYWENYRKLLWWWIFAMDCVVVSSRIRTLRKTLESLQKTL